MTALLSVLTSQLLRRPAAQVSAHRSALAEAEQGGSDGLDVCIIVEVLEILVNLHERWGLWLASSLRRST